MRVVVGIHSCREALKVRKREEIQKVFLKPDWKNNSALTELALLSEKKGLRPEELSLKKLNRLAENHQGVCLHVKGGPKWNLENQNVPSLVLILDGVEDPKNLGAIIRTAWLFGVGGIFISRRRSGILTPSVMKAASGGAEHVPLSFENPINIVKFLKERHFWVYGLDSSSGESLWRETFGERVAFVLGGEHAGLRSGLQKGCDKKLFIPQAVKEASYNVSVAAGIVLSEYCRQQKSSFFKKSE